MLLRRHKFWLHRQFLRPIPETKKRWVMVSFGATAADEPNSKRLLSTSCNKQGQCSSAGHFFHGVIPDAFEVRRIVCVEN